MDLDKRFQCQPWYVRAWRLVRHYPRIPLDAWRMWRYDDDEHYDWSICWSIAKGLAQARMKWFFTLEEVLEDLKCKDSGQK